MGRYATIVGTGMYLPEIEVSNAQLAQEIERTATDMNAGTGAGTGAGIGASAVMEKFEAATGIRRRWYAPRDWTTSDLAVRAGRQALEAAGLKPGDIDLIILGTDSPDYVTPATSVVVQHKLGARHAGTYDVGCACASFPTAVAAAAGQLTTNTWMKYVLVIGAYMMSKLADADDVTRFYYGDGAGAAVMCVDTKPGFLTASYNADGAYHRNWGIYSGGTFEPATCESVQAGRARVKFIERYPPEVNHEGWPKIVRCLAQRGGFGLDDIDMAIFTQVRLGSIKVVMEDLGLPLEKTHWIMEDWGYTGSACVPMAFDDAVRRGKVRSGDLVVLVGSGVGYNQAGVALRMP